MSRHRQSADLPNRSRELRRRRRAPERHWRPRVERLEDRMMLAFDALVSGTASADTIIVENRGAELVVTVNAQPHAFDISQLNLLEIRSLGGNDTITIFSTHSGELRINAGSGADHVNLGAGRFYALNSHTITIDGGGNPQDALEIHDEASIGDARDYQISSEAFTRRGDGTVAVFEGFSTILLLQNQESTTTEVGPIGPGVLLAITDFGIDDSDTYLVGHDVLDGLDATEGTLRLSAREGDHIILNDADSAVTNGNYVITTSNPSGPPSTADLAILDLPGTGRIEISNTAVLNVVDVEFRTSRTSNETRIRHTPSSRRSPGRKVWRSRPHPGSSSRAGA
jgi:hypothetical protein